MVAQVFHANLADLDSTPQVPLGAIYELDNKRYKYVKFSGTTAIAVGAIVCYVAAGSDGAEVIVDGANSALGAGVAVNAVGTGTPLYGWIQITGLVTVANAPAGSPAFGDNLTTNGASAANVTKSTASNMQIVGNFYTSTQIVAEFPN